jgi:DNA-binding NarL/FixJ family response regulator
MSEGQRVRLLFVEDSPFFVDAVRIVLNEITSLEMEFTVSHTLEDALRSIRTSQFDVVLLDLGLPDSSGLDTLHSIRPKLASTPIIVFTGNNDEQTAVEALKLGAQDYLLKQELNGRFLARAIHYAIERSRNIALDAERLRLYEERESVMAVITHDLKNPLIGANRVLDLLQVGALGKLQPQQLDIISKLKHSNDELLNMVRTLL